MPVRFLRSIYLAEDETCVHAAESEDAVREAAPAGGSHSSLSPRWSRSH
jgi:hypothetical protein